MLSSQKLFPGSFLSHSFPPYRFCDTGTIPPSAALRQKNDFANFPPVSDKSLQQKNINIDDNNVKLRKEKFSRPSDQRSSVVYFKRIILSQFHTRFTSKKNFPGIDQY